MNCRSLLTFACFMLAPLAAFAPLATAAEPSGDALDQEVYWALKKNCTKCHDDLGDTRAAAGVADLLDLETLAAGYLDPSDEELVNDLLLGDEARMPKPVFDEFEWSGPLTAADRALFRKWVDRGGPSDEYLASRERPTRSPITGDHIAESILSDVQSLSTSDARHARYLTLTNLHNDARVSPSELEIYRAAIVKVLNSLSSVSDVIGTEGSPAPNKVIAVDADRTIYRFDLRDIGWEATTWDRVASHDPFATELSSATQQAIRAATSPRPMLRADWFVFATLQPPLYHELVGIPESLSDLEDSLGIKRLDSIRQRRVARAGMIESKVSVNNRLLERIPLTDRAGAYHISYDFASNTGEQNFRDFPLGPPGAFETDKSFRHDGGEVIFNLPNGYQAYMLVDGVGGRLDIAPQAIVQDRTMPGSVIINGVSCLSCHYQGMKPEKFSPLLDQLDEVRAAVHDNNVRFRASEQELVAELHPEHERFKELVERDRTRFLEALAASGIPQRGATEPARALFDHFKNDLDLTTVAAEFGMPVSEIRRRLARESETRQVLTAAENGTLKRQQWLGIYGRISRLIGMGSVRTPAALPYPYFGEQTDKLATNVRVEQNATPDVGYTGVDVVDAENRDGALKIDMWTEDERRSFQDGDTLRVRLRATGDCFLTLVSIDPLGDMTLLMPNAFHGNFPLSAGRTITIPTAEMDFEFLAQPPHGRTILKAIATKRPLRLTGVSQERLVAEVLPSLGRAKGFGVRRKQSAPVSATPAKRDRLAVEAIETQFAPNEWATSSFTVTTRP